MGERFEKIKVRTLTIIISVPIILLIIHQGGIFFYLTVSLIAILGNLEILNISRNKNFHPSLVLGIIATLFFLLQKSLPGIFIVDKRLFFTLMILLIFMKHFLTSGKQYLINNISMTLFTAIYIGHFLSFLIDIRGLNHGETLTIFALFTTWMSDVVAYIVGISLGRRHPFTTISPNKTLEGSIGGIFGGAFCGIAFSFLLPFKPLTLFALGLLAAISGQIGDLFESMIKRSFDTKDSGKLLPGHGGILDCMDSILFSVPVLYFCFFYLIE